MYQLMCYAERVFPRPTMSLHIGGSSHNERIALPRLAAWRRLQRKVSPHPGIYGNDTMEANL
ncbi:unnamed protein product [Acanthoscelides obtectus]|uniref:Uncharacterized protein n=1 Tax=Acanthoscelides obtectus TaxID=200917 RepID=A0A9P0LC13_ACAOB|nr:unnamed protein product [Acanthoscelides obtectus]CAK1646836.1 hypothetical protein AOBTE_LOCUS14883 [Acanthoscelides obtectus]